MMSEELSNEIYERKVTGAERFFSHSPFSIVTMVARIKGEVTEEMLSQAVAKLQDRHVLLKVRIREEGDALWFSSEGVGGISIEVIARKSDEDWIEIHAEASKIPFKFETHPLIRFVLVRSPQASELIILCHHMICDGMSLAFLARDLMVCLGDPAAEVEVLPVPEPVTLENLPNGLSLPGIVKTLINRIKRKWSEEIVGFDQADYETLTKAYWERYSHEICVIELTEAETSALVTRSRNEGVTVNSAIAAAFSGAQSLVRDEKSTQLKVATAVSLRDRLPKSPGEAMGYYAAGFDLKLKFNQKKNFWENARVFHKKLESNYSDKKIFGDFLNFLQMDSNIYEAMNFKKLGALVPSDSPRYEKIASFNKRDDVVVSLLKRVEMESLDSKILDTAITNLGRLDFPTTYGVLELDRLIMQPGGAFPLVHVDLVVGVVTVGGKMSIVLEFTEDNVDVGTIEKIKDQAVDFLFQK